MFARLFVFIALLGSGVHAAATHPCREIAKQCRTQGYSIGGVNSSGQGLIKDCLEKIIAGQTLPGIQIDFEIVSACKVRFDRRVAADRGVRPSRRLSSEPEAGESPRAGRRESTGFVEYSGQTSAPRAAGTGHSGSR